MVYFLSVQTKSHELFYGDLAVFLIFLFSFSLIVNLDFQLLLVNLSMGLCLFLLIFCLINKKVEEKLEKKKCEVPHFSLFFFFKFKRMQVFQTISKLQLS